MTKTKINLLTRSSDSGGNRRRPQPKQYRSSVFVLIFAFIMIGFEVAFLWTFYQNISQQEFQSKKSYDKFKEIHDETNQRIERLKLTQKPKDVENAMPLSNLLQRDNKQLISVLATVSHHLPSKAWISYLSQKDNQVTVNGFATEHSIVSNFLLQLQSSNLFKSVKLVTTEQAVQQQHHLKKFTITCEVKPI